MLQPNHRQSATRRLRGAQAVGGQGLRDGPEGHAHAEDVAYAARAVP